MHHHNNVATTCQSFVDSVKRHYPEFLLKPKIHLLLHLHENMTDFGPTMSYNTERYVVLNDEYIGIAIHMYCTHRCETFNGVMRAHNLHSNRRASSRDISSRFAVMEQLKFLTEGGTNPTNDTVR